MSNSYWLTKVRLPSSHELTNADLFGQVHNFISRRRAKFIFI